MYFDKGLCPLVLKLWLFWEIFIYDFMNRKGIGTFTCEPTKKPKFYQKPVS